MSSARAALGHQPTRSQFAGRGPLIAFSGPPGTIPTYSFSDVAAGRFPRGTFNDKVVVVGAVAPSLQDLSATVDLGQRADAGAGAAGGGDPDDPRRLPPAAHSRLDRDPADGPVRADPAGARGPPAAVHERADAAARGVRRRAGARCRVPRRRAGRVQQRARPAGGAPADRAGPVGDLHARGAAARRGVGPAADPRPVRALRSREGRGPGRRERGRGTAARRRAAPGDGAVQRPARLHDLLGVAAAGGRHRRAERVPRRDDRRDPRRGRHARRLHGRRHHGRLRRAARPGRPRGPRAAHRAQHARAARALQRDGASRARRRSGWASG